MAVNRLFPFIFNDILYKTIAVKRVTGTIAGLIKGDKTELATIGGLIKGDKTELDTVAGDLTLQYHNWQSIASILKGEKYQVNTLGSILTPEKEVRVTIAGTLTLDTEDFTYEITGKMGVD